MELQPSDEHASMDALTSRFQVALPIQSMQILESPQRE
jgi:hypothetical protein